ncbi:hypothetical protein UA38_12115 [Photobacterium kishitanii]|uniref:Uncharacterized protein n=1 Tax=Photobacterium kishitanii TaxID=318456 RepID=A0AAX0YTM3_9GAMM|nr:hypothetical protein [Photobacterium kishitanii]KJG57109.1 hypothetical protein UA38_12115 [Photobacterium kishitanii]KJG60637.1 hypothetical protein UA42_14920 [Photobacterium kishitanii]KJG64939.1 hypothetical protein UA40_14615 [Photobacterium kishitanii]KJG66181.1 hypothetical protein UA41_21285 [Photobacterium kishitanii]PSX18269.1 hypothetical protein C0W70_15470 [Photobacterium kishitanii]
MDEFAEANKRLEDESNTPSILEETNLDEKITDESNELSDNKVIKSNKTVLSFVRKHKTVVTIISTIVCCTIISATMDSISFSSQKKHILTSLSNYDAKIETSFEPIRSNIRRLNESVLNLDSLVAEDAEIINIKNSLNQLKLSHNSLLTDLKEIKLSSTKIDKNSGEYEKLKQSINIALLKIDTLNEQVIKIKNNPNVNTKINDSAKKKITPTKKKKAISVKPKLGNYNFITIDSWGDESVLVLSNNNKIERYRIGNTLTIKDTAWKITAIYRDKNKAILSNKKSTLFIGK